MKRLKVLKKFQKIHLLTFFLSSSTASVSPSITTYECSNDFIIFIILFIFSFEINEFFFLIWQLFFVKFLDCFITVDILLAKPFPILTVYVVARNNSCGNSSSSKLSLFNLSIVPIFFLLHILNCLIGYLITSVSLLDNFPSFIILSHFLATFLILHFWFFYKSLKIDIDSLVTTASSEHFNCPKSSICSIAFGYASNSFCLPK